MSERDWADEKAWELMLDGCRDQTGEEMCAAIATALRAAAAVPAGCVEALEKMLSAMNMQEGRESGEFHIPPYTAKAIWDEAKEAAQAALAAREGKPPQAEQVMPRVNGKPFKCDCGCNVFTKTEPLKYRCNSCEATYTGEREDGQ